MAKIWKKWNLKVENHNEHLIKSGKRGEMWNPLIIFLPIATGVIAGLCIYLFYVSFEINAKYMLRDMLFLSLIVAGWTVLFLIGNWYTYEPYHKINRR